MVTGETEIPLIVLLNQAKKSKWIEAATGADLQSNRGATAGFTTGKPSSSSIDE